MPDTEKELNSLLIHTLSINIENSLVLLQSINILN